MQRGRGERKAETVERVTHAFYCSLTCRKVTVRAMWFVIREGETHFSNSKQEKAFTGAWTKLEIVC